MNGGVIGGTQRWRERPTLAKIPAGSVDNGSSGQARVAGTEGRARLGEQPDRRLARSRSLPGSYRMVT